MRHLVVMFAVGFAVGAVAGDYVASWSAQDRIEALVSTQELSERVTLSRGVRAVSYVPPTSVTPPPQQKVVTVVVVAYTPDGKTVQANNASVYFTANGIKYGPYKTDAVGNLVIGLNIGTSYALSATWTDALGNYYTGGNLPQLVTQSTDGWQTILRMQ